MNKVNKPLMYAFRQDAERYQLYLYDTITSQGDFDWETFNYKESETSAKHMRDQLAEIPDGATIELHVNSCGGEVGEGAAIYNLLKQKAQAGCKIIGFVDGFAYSVAMDIICAASEIHMGLGTSMLLHYPWVYMAGNAKDLRSMAEQLDALGDASVELYLHRTNGKITEEELRAMMDKETTLSPQDCLKYGFCDVVDTYEAETPEQSVARVTQAIKAQAETVVEQAAEVETEEPAPEAEEKNSDMTETFLAAIESLFSNK